MTETRDLDGPGALAKRPEAAPAGPLRDPDHDVLLRLAMGGSYTRTELALIWTGALGGMTLFAVMAMTTGIIESFAWCIGAAAAIVLVAGILARGAGQRRVRRQIDRLERGELDAAMKAARRRASRFGRHVELCSARDGQSLHMHAMSLDPDSSEPLPRIVWDANAGRLLGAAVDIALCELRRGEPEAAVQILCEIWRGCRKVPNAAGLEPIVRVYLALGYAVLGELDAAASWSQGLAPRYPLAKVVDALVHARREDWAAVRTLECPEPGWGAHAVGHVRRTFWLLKAFAAERAGDDGAAVTDMLESARPVCAGELDYLSAHWPELARFRQERELPARAALAAGRLPPARLASAPPEKPKGRGRA